MSSMSAKLTLEICARTRHAQGGGQLQLMLFLLKQEMLQALNDNSLEDRRAATLIACTMDAVVELLVKA